MKETEIQLEICKDIRKAHPGAVAYKQTNQFLSGKPDLFIAHTSIRLNCMMLEVKTDKQGPKKDRDGYPVGLTDLQRKELRDLQKAGVRCGWAMVVQIGNGRRAMFVSPDPEAERTPALTTCLNGFDWTIRADWWRRWPGGEWALPWISERIG